MIWRKNFTEKINETIDQTHIISFTVIGCDELILEMFPLLYPNIDTLHPAAKREQRKM